MSKNFEYELLLRVEAAEKNIEHLASKMAKDFDRAGKKAEQAAEVAAKAHAKVFTNHAKMLDRIAKMEAEHAKELLDWQIKLATMRGKEGQRQWDAEQLRHKQVMDNAAAEEAARISANHAQILVDQKARDARQKGLESAFKAGIPLDLGMEKERNRLALVNAEIEKRIGSILDQNLKKKQDAIKAEERRLAKGQAKYDRIYGGGGVPLDKMEAKQAAQDAATTARIEAEQLSTYRQKLDFLEQMRAKYGQVAAAARVLDTLEQDLSKFGSQKMAGGGGTVAQTYNATPAAQADIDAKMEESIRKQLDGAKEVADAQQHHRDVLSDVVKEHDKLKKNYTDPSSRQAIDDATDSFKKQAEAIENSSAPIADQKKQLTTLRKETKDGLNEQLKTMNVVTEKDKKANDEALERAKRLLNDRRTTDRIRYQNNEQILRSLEEAEARHNNVLGKLERDRLTMTKALYAERVQAAIAAANAESDALIQAGARQANADAAKAAGQGRVVSMVFQTQQALEDFSYAGIRGAANNIAMMASNMGGSGGIIALLGIGVVQAGSYFGWWEKINESMGGALWKTEKQIELAKELVKLQWENFDRTSGTAQDLAKFDPTKTDTASLKEELRNTQTDIKFERERAATAMGLKTTYEDLVRLANELGGMADTGGFDLGILSESPETIADNADTVRENLRFMGLSDEAYAEHLQTIAKIESAVTATRKAGFSVSEEGMKAANDAAKEYSKTLADSIAKEASLKEKIKRTELVEPLLKLQKESVTVLKEQEDSLERQLSTSQKLAESARERALQAAAATEEYKRTAALSQMELQDKRSDLVAKEKMDQIDKQAKAGMDWASNRKQGIEGWAEQRAKQLKAMGYDSGAVDSQLAAFKQRLNAEYEAFIKHGQAKVEAAKKQATDQAEAEKKAREDSYKQLETNRAGMLGSQAATAELGGDFDKALRLTKEREEVLKDLRTREVDKVGRGSLADTDAAIAQVRALDEMITRGRETTESLHEKIANKAEQDAAGFKQKLDEIVGIRENIEKLDMVKDADIRRMAQLINQHKELESLRSRLSAGAEFTGKTDAELQAEVENSSKAFTDARSGRIRELGGSDGRPKASMSIADLKELAGLYKEYADFSRTLQPGIDELMARGVQESDIDTLIRPDVADSISKSFSDAVVKREKDAADTLVRVRELDSAMQRLSGTIQEMRDAEQVSESEDYKTIPHHEAELKKLEKQRELRDQLEPLGGDEELWDYKDQESIQADIDYQKERLEELRTKKEQAGQTSLSQTADEDMESLSQYQSALASILNTRQQIASMPMSSGIAPMGGVAPSLATAGGGGGRMGASVSVTNNFPVSTSAALSSLSHHMANAAAASRVRQGLS